MILDYKPTIVGLKHPFRYINGVKIIKGRNTISDRDYSLLKANDTFLKLIEESAIVFIEEKAKTPTKVKKEKVVVSEPIPEPDPTPEPENITTEPEVAPEVKPEAVTPEEFTKLNYKDAIALVESVDDKDTLLAYQVAEQGSGVRIKVLKAIELKLGTLE